LTGRSQDESNSSLFRAFDSEPEDDDDGPPALWSRKARNYESDSEDEDGMAEAEGDDSDSDDDCTVSDGTIPTVNPRGTRSQAREKRVNLRSGPLSEVVLTPSELHREKRTRLTMRNPEREVSHSVHTIVSVLESLASIGVVSTSLSTWTFIPSSMTGCKVAWALVSSTPTPEQRSVYSQITTELKMPLEFEPRKEGWLDRLKAQPVDVLVLEQDI
jgi:hypothetical protein